jgi:hypothetical protein
MNFLYTSDAAVLGWPARKAAVAWDQKIVPARKAGNNTPPDTTEMNTLSEEL